MTFDVAALDAVAGGRVVNKARMLHGAGRARGGGGRGADNSANWQRRCTLFVFCDTCERRNRRAVDAWDEIGLEILGSHMIVRFYNARAARALHSHYSGHASLVDR